MKTKSIKVEQRILLVCLQTEDQRIQQYILSQTTEDDFATEEGKQIRKTIEDMMRRGRAIPKAEIFAETPALTKSATTFVLATPEALEKAERASFRFASSTVDTLKNLRKSRNLLENIQSIADRCKDEVSELTLTEAEKLLEKSLREIRDRGIQEGQTAIGAGMTEENVKQIVLDATTPDEREIIPTGLDGLNMQLKGFKRGDLVVVSASRGGGKTAVALQMAWEQFKAGCNVAFVSLEMPWKQLESRLISHVTGDLYSAVRLKFRDLSKPERKQLRKRMLAKLLQEMVAVGEEKKCKFVPFDRRAGEYTPFQLEMELAMADCKFDVVFIDYLSLLKSDAKERFEKQIEIAAFLKGMAIQRDCVVIVLTQLNDDGHVKYGRGPEEAADYWLYWNYGEQERATGNVEINLGKARHGETCKIPAKFNMSIMRINTFPPQKATIAESATKVNEWGAGEV